MHLSNDKSYRVDKIVLIYYDLWAAMTHLILSSFKINDIKHSEMKTTSFNRF